jgi:hypothetical protein
MDHIYTFVTTYPIAIPVFALFTCIVVMLIAMAHEQHND